MIMRLASWGWHWAWAWKFPPRPDSKLVPTFASSPLELELGTAAHNSLRLDWAARIPGRPQITPPFGPHFCMRQTCSRATKHDSRSETARTRTN